MGNICRPAKKVVAVEPAPPPKQISSEDANEQCRFFCPLCMLFYEGMLKAGCCDQYICQDCAMSYLAGKSIDCDAASLIEELPPIDCPYCANDGLVFMTVPLSELPRRYEDSPAVAAKLASRVRPVAPGAPSPLKTGDTFEDMKRKMTFFDEGKDTSGTPRSQANSSNNSIHNSSAGSVSGHNSSLDSSGNSSAGAVDVRAQLEQSFKNLPTLPESPFSANEGSPSRPEEGGEEDPRTGVDAPHSPLPGSVNQDDNSAAADGDGVEGGDLSCPVGLAVALEVAAAKHNAGNETPAGAAAVAAVEAVAPGVSDVESGLEPEAEVEAPPPAPAEGGAAAEEEGAAVVAEVGGHDSETALPPQQRADVEEMDGSGAVEAVADGDEPSPLMNDRPPARSVQP